MQLFICFVQIQAKPETYSPSSDQNNNGSTAKRTYRKQGRKKLKSANSGTQSSSSANSNDQQTRQQENEKQNKIKELFDLIENSYQNAYFNRCKSYKKAKLSDLDFEFDFSKFDSHNPYYPSALEDINTKINRTNSFWNSIDKTFSRQCLIRMW